MGGIVIEGTLGHLGSGGLGDGDGGIGGEGVKDVDVVGPGDGGERAGQVVGFVFGEDQDRDH